MILTIESAEGGPFEFECEDTIASAWVSRGILEATTYPIMPFVDNVRVIVDAGGNCGATSVHFARHYPDAIIHTIEPGSHQRAILERNAAGYPAIHVHPIALGDTDSEQMLFQGSDDSGMSSLTESEWTATSGETVTVRAADAWAAEYGIDRIDVLKLDIEGYEAIVLRSLGDLISATKVIYVEYDSRHARREIDRLLEPTHHLYAGKIFLDQGEIVYLSNAEADKEAATDHLRSLFVPD